MVRIQPGAVNPFAIQAPPVKTAEAPVQPIAPVTEKPKALVENNFGKFDTASTAYALGGLNLRESFGFASLQHC
jgi:hypothetical protein